jgi:hypothetical protein
MCHLLLQNLRRQQTQSTYQRIYLARCKCIFGKMLRVSSGHLIYTPMQCWYKESVILRPEVHLF